MKNSKMKWALILMGISIALYLPSILQLFKADLYCGIYLENLSGMTLGQVEAFNPGVAETIMLGFQGIGLGALTYHMLAWVMLFIPFRRAEKWSWYTLGFTQLILWIINFILESRGDGNTFLLVYSMIPLVCIIVSMYLTKDQVFSPKN